MAERRRQPARRSPASGSAASKQARTVEEAQRLRHNEQSRRRRFEALDAIAGARQRLQAAEQAVHDARAVWIDAVTAGRGKGVTVGEAAEASGISRSAMTQALAKRQRAAASSVDALELPRMEA